MSPPPVSMTSVTPVQAVCLIPTTGMDALTMRIAIFVATSYALLALTSHLTLLARHVRRTAKIHKLQARTVSEMMTMRTILRIISAAVHQNE